MNGREVFRNAVTRFPEVIKEAMDAHKMNSNDIDLLHHYKQLNNVHYWDLVSKLSENWVAFNAMSINDENEHESKFFQLYHLHQEKKYILLWLFLNQVL